MERITVTGVLDPMAALDLRVQLHEATDRLRPAVTVDLTQVRGLHLAAVSALVSAARRAQRQGGDLHVVFPTDPVARRELELTSWFANEQPRSAILHR